MAMRCSTLTRATKLYGTLDGVAWPGYETVDGVVMTTKRRRAAIPPAQWRRVSMGSRLASENLHHLHPNTSLSVEHIAIVLKCKRTVAVLVLLEAARLPLVGFPDDVDSGTAITGLRHLHRLRAP
jgi:hypothetical protein